MFYLQPEHTIEFLNNSASPRVAFKGLQARIGPGRLGGADGSVPRSRLRLFESPTGVFMVQVRGVLSDCPLPALNVDPIRCELSLEWKKLFDRDFGERKLATAVSHGAPVYRAPAHTTDLYSDSQSLATLELLINQLSPGLQALARLDWRTHCRHFHELEEAATRIQRLQRPVQTWTDAMGEEFGQTNATLERYLHRGQADRAINLDDERVVNKAKVTRERRIKKAAEFWGGVEWNPLVKVRIINIMAGRADLT